MIKSLLDRTVEKCPDKVQLQGRILFLAEDAAIVRAQLEGHDLDPGNIPPLRNDISTDEITPAYICYHFDEKIGEFVYLGLKCGDEFPIKAGDVKRGNFTVSVSGKRRGKGSSREQSPYAEIAAGIRCVIAENIERIYRQNCQNLGLLASTNFDLIQRIADGEEIALEEFTRGEDEITRQIIEYGGLFPFNVARLQGKVQIPPVATAPRPMTLAEKIFARHFVTDLSKDAIGVTAVKPGDAGFVRTDIRFSHEYVTPMAAIFYEQLEEDGGHRRDVFVAEADVRAHEAGVAGLDRLDAEGVFREVGHEMPGEDFFRDGHRAAPGGDRGNLHAALQAGDVEREEPA